MMNPQIYHVLMQSLLVVAFISTLISFMNTILKRFISLFDSAKNSADNANNRVSTLEQRVSELESALSQLAHNFQDAKPEETNELAEIEQALAERGV